MEEVIDRSGIVRFGPFEVDRREGELRKAGLKIRLPRQPFEVLIALIDHAGELVTREELQGKIWPADTFVDFDRGLNKAINRIRAALNDSSDRPRYIETIPKRGYRFISVVEAVEPARVTTTPAAAANPAEPRQFRRQLRFVFACALAALVTAALIAYTVDRRGAAAPSIRIKSLAVLPLENLSKDPERDYFADGMTDELITALARIDAFHVTARTSAMRYKRSPAALPDIARELGVDAVVEGSVLHDGSRVRITARLVDAARGIPVWTGRYERDSTDILALQDEVAKAIAGQVSRELSPGRQTRAPLKVNREAYEATLKGHYFLDKRNGADRRKAIEYFRQAIAIDPNYAAGYAGLANSIIVPIASTGRGAMREAKAAATRALELDGSLAEAHTSLAYIRFLGDWDWAGAEKEFRRAIELNPNYVTAHQWYGVYLATFGRMHEAKAEFERARQLDPVSIIANWHVAFGSYMAGDYKRAIEQWRSVLDMDPNFGWADVWMGTAYEELGNKRDAIAHYQKARQLGNQGAMVARAALVAGDREQALKAARELSASGGGVDESGSVRVAPYALIAGIYASLGEKDLAFASLEKAYQERAGGLVFIKAYPWYKSLHSDPRFEDLARRVGLP